MQWVLFTKCSSRGFILWQLQGREVREGGERKKGKKNR